MRTKIATLRGSRFRLASLVVYYFPEKRPFRECSECQIEANQGEHGVEKSSANHPFRESGV